MRIHRLVLRNYRGVAEVEVSFPTRGVTIVEGDNEVGKTSLVEALDLLLTERDDASKRVLKAVKPAGRDVGAEVEAELSSGPYRFRYRKRWHKQKETVLEVLEPGRSQLTGREAHDRVRAILDETLDSSLWEALRLTQGAALAQSAFAGGSLGRALDLAAGGETAGERGDDLWARVTAERDRHWTATGQPKVERQALARELAGARARVEELETTLAGLQADADEVGRLVVESRGLGERQREHEARVGELAEQVDAIRRQRNEVERLTAARDAARARHDHAFAVSEARDGQVRRLAELEATVVELAEAAAAAAPARRVAEERLDVTRRAVEAAKDDARRAEAASRRAIGDRDHLRQQIERDLLAERHARVVDAAGLRAEAQGIMQSAGVDGDLLRRIEAAHVDLARAEAAADTAAASVRTVALADVDVELDGRTVALADGQVHEVRVAGMSEVVVPGAVRVVVTAGAEAQVLADGSADARAAVEHLCAEGRVADVAEARQAAGARADAERVVAHAEEAIARDLRDLSLDDLARKVEHLDERVAAYAADRPPEPPLPSDLDTAQRVAAELEADLQARHDRLDRLEADLVDASAAVQQLRLGDAGSRARLEQAEAAAEHERGTLDKSRAEVPDDEVAGRLHDARAVLAASESALSESEAALAAQHPDDVEHLLANAQGVARRLADECHGNEQRTLRLRASLAARGDEGLAHTLDEARSELARLSLVHEQTEARASAARLLHDTVAARRTQAHQRYVAPFRERIEQLGRVVFGPTLEVELDDDLRIARRTLGGVTLDFADLSTGAKEQLGMLGRLACAAIVAEDGGAPVVFDDALGWSDPDRLERMGAAIALAGRSCQVIVLTCTPGRYAGVGHAAVVRLPG